MEKAVLEIVPPAPLALVGIAAVVDIRTRRIPNLLTFGGAAVGLLYQAWAGGWHGLGQGASGWAVGVALLFPMFFLRGMGAGDVKLLAAVGAWFGPVAVLRVGLYAVCAGGVLALVIGARAGYLGKAFANLWSLFGFWRMAGLQPAPGMTLEDASGPRLPYGVAIAAGTAIAAWLK